jgi:hypothetical protein
MLHRRDVAQVDEFFAQVRARLEQAAQRRTA